MIDVHVIITCFAVILTPSVQYVCPQQPQTITFTCMTNTTALLLAQGSDLQPYNSMSMLNVPETLGIFTVELTSISSNGFDLTATATVTNTSSLLSNSTVTLICDDDGNGIGGKEALLINGR